MFEKLHRHIITITKSSHLCQTKTTLAETQETVTVIPLFLLFKCSCKEFGT